MLEKIKILQEFGFGELCSRLRKVSLRGFPNVKIYGNARIKIDSVSPEKIREEIFTPQPSIYKTELDKVAGVAELFLKKGIDIFQLDGGVDYLSYENKETKEWTIIPSVIEVLPIKFNLEKGLDYSESIGDELKVVMNERGYILNPELKNLDFLVYEEFRGKTVKILEICDGSHRIELAVRKNLEQKLLFIDSPVNGFPYYAAPKPYNCIHEEPERIEEKLDKTHVLTSPGHKLLYRLFPSGRIKSGTVRPLKEKFD